MEEERPSPLASYLDGGEWSGMILLVSVGPSVYSDHVKLLCNSSVMLSRHQPSRSTGEVEGDWPGTDTWEDGEGN